MRLTFCNIEKEKTDSVSESGMTLSWILLINRHSEKIKNQAILIALILSYSESVTTFYKGKGHPELVSGSLHSKI